MSDDARLGRALRTALAKHHGCIEIDEQPDGVTVNVFEHDSDEPLHVGTGRSVVEALESAARVRSPVA